ncbi:membrane dipeptidase, partial [Pseudomonas sp. NPDC089569]|uniref:membrane dipeptidase n=1 Tax=Pseudomonas sp. NPDC089569 TaxID=3390722 RepID=UPI003CFFD3ED
MGINDGLCNGQPQSRVFAAAFPAWHGQDFFEYLTHDKGYARRLTNFGKIINPLGIRTVGEFPNLTETLLKRGHSERVVRKIMGENWVNVLKDVWGE